MNSTEKNLHPADGDLELAIVLMTVRYGDSCAIAMRVLRAEKFFDSAAYDRANRQSDRQLRAVQRLVAALARTRRP
jgi:hypothetical protein